MRPSQQLPRLALLLLLTASCHRSGGIDAPVSVNVVDALPTGNTIIPVFGATAIPYYTALTVPSNSAVQYAPSGGPNPLYVVRNKDTTQRIFSGTLNLSPGAIYSFFLSGDTTRPDTLLVQDNIPVYTDSSAGVRFVNLSPGSQPVEVNLKGSTSGQSEFSNLGYKQIGAFKKYAAVSSVPGRQYIFEVRSQEGDSLLLTYTWAYTLHKNNTLVLSGSTVSGTGQPLHIFQVNNY